MHYKTLHIRAHLFGQLIYLFNIPLLVYYPYFFSVSFYLSHFF